MQFRELMRTLQGGRICVVDVEGRLRVRGPRGALTPAAQEAIRQHGAALKMRLTGRLVACRDLYRYVQRGDRVRTPNGDGEVLQVFADQVVVRIGLEEHAYLFKPHEIRSYKLAQAGHKKWGYVREHPYHTTETP